MMNYSATEEATFFNLIFPFLQSKSTEQIKIKIKPCEVRIEKLKWVGGSKIDNENRNKASLPRKSEKSKRVKIVNLEVAIALSKRVVH